MSWPLADAWRETTAVVAQLEQLDLQALRAPSRGRGYKPPEAVREPRKLALYVCLCLTGADYAALGRHVGLHRDTVAGHAAEIRARDDADALSSAIEAMADARLRIADAERHTRHLARSRRREAWSAIAAQAAHALDDLSDEVSEASSDTPATGRRTQRRAA